MSIVFGLLWVAFFLYMLWLLVSIAEAARELWDITRETKHHGWRIGQ